MLEDAHASLAAEMRQFEEKTGLLVFVDTNTYLEQGTKAVDRARALAGAWIGERPGIIFCLNRSAGSVPFMFFSPELTKRYPEPDLSRSANETAAAMDRVSAPENRLPVGVRVMMNRLRALEADRVSRNRLFHRRDLEMMAVFGCVALAFGLLAGILIRMNHRREALDAVQHHFPEVEVGQRFSAPCGGGVIVEVETPGKG